MDVLASEPQSALSRPTWTLYRPGRPLTPNFVLPGPGFRSVLWLLGRVDSPTLAAGSLPVMRQSLIFRILLLLLHTHSGYKQSPYGAPCLPRRKRSRAARSARWRPASKRARRQTRQGVPTPQRPSALPRCGDGRWVAWSPGMGGPSESKTLPEASRRVVAEC